MMSQPVSSSERRNQLSLNGNKKRNAQVVASQPPPVVDVEVNGSQKSRRESQKNGQTESNKKTEKIASFVDNDVIVIDEDDLPLKKIAEIVDTQQEKKESTPVVVADVPKVQESEPQKSRESTPKKKGKNSEKSPRAAQAVIQATTPPAVDQKSPKKTEQEIIKETETNLESVFADDWPEDASKKDTKVLKLTHDILTPKRRSDRLQNASTIVNLSTVSEQSTKQDVGAMETDSSGLLETSNRKISGRRSTRPIDEIRFTYRAKNFDDSLNSSVNATIGSELNASFPSTPSTDRKRALSSDNLESPKRARLDFSGLWSTVVSPVTMLRERLRRAHLQSSTPNKGPEKIIDSVDELDISIEEDVKKDNEEKPEVIEENKSEEKFEEVKIDSESTEEVVAEPQEETQEKAPRKRGCNVM